MKQLKYFLSIILSMIAILLPLIGVVSLYYEWDYNAYIIIGTVLIAVLTFKPLHILRNYCRNAAEYDEFGHNKKKKYDNLSRRERELIDLQNTAIREQIFSSSELKRITKKGSQDPYKDIEKLIGLSDVKTKMEEMAARMEFDA